MRNDDTHPGHRTLRLPQIDYSLPGAYFVTIVTQDRLSLFGKIENGDITLNAAGQMVSHKWNELAHRFPFIELDHFVVMPNHLHGILMIMPYSKLNGEQGVGANPVFAPFTTVERSHDTELMPKLHGTDPGTLGRIIQDFKTGTTNWYIEGVQEQGWPKFPGRLWQWNYYEKIIRDERMLNELREYIITNPLRWEFDKENLNRNPG